MEELLYGDKIVIENGTIWKRWIPGHLGIIYRAHLMGLKKKNLQSQNAQINLDDFKYIFVVEKFDQPFKIIRKPQTPQSMCYLIGSTGSPKVAVLNPGGLSTLLLHKLRLNLFPTSDTCQNFRLGNYNFRFIRRKKIVSNLWSNGQPL